jgi:hypothetical protein
MNYDELHDQLLKEFRAYFEDYQTWATTESHASGMRARAHLSEIRRIASALRVEILETRKLKPKIKSPAYRAARLAEQQAQNQQAHGDDDAN